MVTCVCSCSTTSVPLEVVLYYVVLYLIAVYVYSCSGASVHAQWIYLSIYMRLSLMTLYRNANSKSEIIEKVGKEWNAAYFAYI